MDMKSTATIFLHFLLVAFLEIRLVQSIRLLDGQVQGQSVPSKLVQTATTNNNNKEQATNKNPNDNVNGTVHRGIESDGIQREWGWEPVGEMIVGEAANDQSGYSIALSDDGRIIAIGAPENYGGGTRAGQVRVFRMTNMTNNNVAWTWKQIGSDIDGKKMEHLGDSLDISVDGTRLVIGGPRTTNLSGVVRIYENVNDEWVQVGADLQGNDEYDHSGRSVAMSSDGTVIAVGAREDDGNGSSSGSVSVYEYLEKSRSWELVGSKLYGDGVNDWFGQRVSLSGDALVLAVGAPGHNNDGAGYATLYKYERINAGERDFDWVQHAKLNGHISGDQFGSAISLSRDASYLAVSGYNNVMVKVYNVSKDESADVLQVANNIPVQDPWAAISMSNDGKLLIVGDGYDDEFGKDAGRAQVFRLNGQVWEQVGGDLYSLDDRGIFATKAKDHRFGYSVAISGDGSTVAAGARYSDLWGTGDSGHVRVFKMGQQPPKQPPSNNILVIGLGAGAGINLVIVTGLAIYRFKKGYKKEETENDATEEPKNQPTQNHDMKEDRENNATEEPNQNTQDENIQENNAAGGTKDSSNIIHGSQNHDQQQQQRHVFFSTRFLGDETERQAKQLHRELQNLGVKTFMVEYFGQTCGQEVNLGLVNMAVLLTICSSNYGEKTEASYSTYHELEYACEHDIPVFPIKLCDEWPPHPPKDFDGGDRGWEMNQFVFKKDLIYCDWSNKNWDATECAKEVKTALEKMGRCPLV